MGCEREGKGRGPDGEGRRGADGEGRSGVELGRKGHRWKKGGKKG